VIRLHASSAGLDPSVLIAGRDLVLACEPEHGLELPRGVLVDDPMLELDPDLVQRGFQRPADLVALLRDDGHLRCGLQQHRGQIVDLGRRRLAAGEHPEVDPDFDRRRVVHVRCKRNGGIDHGTRVPAPAAG